MMNHVSLATVLILSSSTVLYSNDITLWGHNVSVHGPGGVKYHEQHNYLGRWRDARTTLSWDIDVITGGTVTVTCIQGAWGDNVGNVYDVVIGDKRVSGTTVDTKFDKRFKAVELGDITIAKPGLYTVTVVPHPKTSQYVMTLRGIRLVGHGNFKAKKVIPPDEQRGIYFSKTQYTLEPLPVFGETREKLPQPIFDEDPRYVEFYWRAWELAFKSFRQPHSGSPFVSNYIDEAFNDSLFMWDTAFMTMFCNYGHPYVPGIQSLDNFYCTQLRNGEIVREISEITGEPLRRFSKPGTPASLNHPILAWAEIESYMISADKDRLKAVYPSLVAYYRSYEQIKDPDSGFYLGTWASMDNSPRNDGMLCSIDTTSEMVLFARNLAFISHELGLRNEAQQFESDAEALSDKINEKLWDPKSKFYYDWSKDHSRHTVKTIAGYWPLLAHIASKEQAEYLASHLKDPKQFARLHMVPTIPADEPEFQPTGHYWRGGVWTPTNMMVIDGLRQYGFNELAALIAENHVENVFKVYLETQTVWEFYQPDAVAVGYQPRHKTRPDFTGWTGNAPIKLFIEYKIGLRLNAPQNEIYWHISSDKRVGVKQLWFGGRKVDLVCEEADQMGSRRLTVNTPEGFTLKWQYGNQEGEQKITAGQNTFSIGGQGH